METQYQLVETAGPAVGGLGAEIERAALGSLPPLKAKDGDWFDQHIGPPEEGPTYADWEILGRRAKRRAYCGHRPGHQYQAQFHRPTSGQYAASSLPCNDWRACLLGCNEWKALELTGRLKVGLREHNGELYKATVKGSDWKSLVDRLVDKGICYLRLPQPDDTMLLFLSDDPDWLDTELIVDEREVKFEPLLRLVPWGKRISGKLGLKQEERDDDGDGEGGSGEDQPATAKIVYEVMFSDATSRQRRAIADQAFEQTKHLDPRTGDQVEAALEVRMFWLKFFTEEAGCKVTHSLRRKTNLEIASIDWSGNRRYFGEDQSEWMEDDLEKDRCYST